MTTIQTNIVDLIQKKIFPAKISFDTHIRQIEPLPGTATVSAFALPGFVDAHVHIESSMLSPAEFARMAVRQGSLAAVTDPHEITNVLGIAGIDFMIDDAAHAPFRFVFGAPSCVPATPFDTIKASLTAEDIDQLFCDGKVSYLSEMMNFPGVLHRVPEVMAKIAVAQKHNKPIDGHAPGLTGDALQQYAQTGITTDHECTTLKEAEEKIRAGMKILIREGSAAKDFENLHPLINQYPDMVMLCTDDLHPDDLLRGHINTLVAKGIEKGLDLFSLLRAATLNPVRHYQINLGLLQVGDSADFIVVDDLKKFAVRQSFLQGVEVFNDGKNRGGVSATSPVLSGYPNSFNASKITASDIEVIATSEQMKVIQAIDGELLTKQLLCPATKGLPVVPNTETDILKIVVLNRYGLAKPAVAFIHGFGLKQGALVSTVAHDSHHIVAVGCDDAALVEAINHVIDLKGGLVAYSDGMMTDLQLDIAGLMSSASGEEVARGYENLNKAASRMGSTLHAPFMTLAFMALLVIPELKLGDKGLFDVRQFSWTELFS